jgi:hypothetical protein
MKYFQALQHLNHIKCLIKSNLMAYKHVDPPRGICANPNDIGSPPRGMCPLGIETI